MNIHLENPVPIKWIVKSDLRAAFTSAVDTIRSHGDLRAVPYCMIIPDVKLVSYDVYDKSFKVDGNRVRNLYNVMTDWQFFYVQFENGKEFDNLGNEQFPDEARGEFFSYIRHYVDTPEDEYVDLDNIVF